MLRRITIIRLQIIGLYTFLFITVMTLLNLVDKGQLDASCAWRRVTGLLCPTCGITRAVKMMIRLKFYEAFLLNPLMTPILLLIICWSGLISFQLWLEKTPSIPPIWVYITIGVLMGIYMIIRNLYPGFFIPI